MENLTVGKRVFVTQLGRAGKVTVESKDVSKRLFAPVREEASLGVLMDGGQYTIYVPLANCHPTTFNPSKVCYL